MDNVSNQLNWMNKHFVLLTYPSVRETVENGLYPCSSDIEDIINRKLSSEDYLFFLESKEDYKEGCSFLAYNLHHRAAVWWAYRCVVDLLKEQKKAPHQPRKIEDIGKPRPLNVPDFAKMPEQVSEPFNVEERISEFRSFRDKAMAEHQERLNSIDPKVKEAFNEALEILQNEVRKKHDGLDLFDLLSLSCEKAIRQQNMDYIVETENSPLMQAKRELESNLEKMRKETIETVKSSLPKVDIKSQNKNKMTALGAVYSYIVSPDEENANKCYVIGNKCPDTPEGLLALCAFWSFGDLMPLGKNIVKTPTGLFGNGLNSLMLMMALAQGGDKKLKERYKTYFYFGSEVATGLSNWSKSLEKKLPPHVEVLGAGIETGEARYSHQDRDFLNIDEKALKKAADNLDNDASVDTASKMSPTSDEGTPSMAEPRLSPPVSVDEAIKNYLSKRFK